MPFNIDSKELENNPKFCPCWPNGFIKLQHINIHVDITYYNNMSTYQQP